jgi:hypothetical protein
MIIINPDAIYSVTAVTADSAYPAINLMNDLPQKYWKSTATTTDGFTIVTDGSTVNGLFIGNTNGTSGTVAVKDVTEATTYETHALSGAYGRFFVAFTSEYTAAVHIVVSLTAATAVEVYAGICRAGAFVSLPDPGYGLKQQPQDFSIKQEMSNGGLNVIIRSMPRSYNLSFIMTHAQVDSIQDVYLARSSKPVAVLLSENINLDEQWCGFFHISDPPSCGYDYPLHTQVSCSLREAV